MISQTKLFSPIRQPNTATATAINYLKIFLANICRLEKILNNKISTTFFSLVDFSEKSNHIRDSVKH